MISGWKLAISAALGGGLAGGMGHDATPVEPVAPTAPEIIQHVAGQRVSVEFDKAPVQEVLDWLKHKGVNFVITEKELDRDARVTLNVQNAPFEDVLQSIAAALGGRWDKVGEMLVFRRGQAFGTRVWTPGAGEHPWSTGFGESFVMPKVQGLSSEEHEKIRKEIEAAMRSSDKVLKDLKIQMPKMHIAPKSHEDWEKMSPEERAKLEKVLAESMKSVEKALEGIHKTVPERIRLAPEFYRRGSDLTPEQRVQIEKEVAEALKSSEKALQEMYRTLPERMRLAPDVHRRWSELTPEQRVQIEKEIAEAMKSSTEAMERAKLELHKQRVIAPGVYAPRAEVLKVQKGNLKQLVESLSPSQLEEHRRDGYLTPQDLTENQRKLLGMESKGNWTIVYKVGGKSITFKGQ